MLSKNHTVVITILLSAASIVIQGNTLLTLQEVQRIAVRNAFEIRISKQAQSSSNWQFWNTFGGYLPDIRYSSQYLRHAENYFTSTTEFFPSASIPGSFGGRALAKVLQQPIDTVPRFQREFPRNMFTHEFSVKQAIINSSAFVGIKIGSAARDVQRYQSHASRQEVIYTVREQYYNAVSAKGRLEAALLSLDFSTESLASARIREESGVAPVTDVLRWEAEIAENRATVSQAESAVELSKLNLLSSMGFDVDTVNVSQIELQPFEDFANECATMITASDTSVDIEQNPSWKAVQVLTKIAKSQKTLALTNYIPVLSGFYSYQWQAFNELFPANGGTWLLGLSLTVPIFPSFKTTSGYFRQKAETEQQIIEREQSRNNFVVSARSALLEYSSSVERLDASALRRDLMEKTLSIMDMRYRAGVVNQTELLQVAVETEQARVAYIQAVLDCLLAKARFKLSTGILEISDVP